MRRKRDRRGFTLTEMLAVVVILAVLSALTAPSLIKNWRNLKLAGLDDTAREIFLSAQGELTEMKASGELVSLAAESGVVMTDSITAGEATQTVYYVTSASGARVLSRTAALLSTVGGTYLLYLNPLSGDVTDVYYSQGALDASQVIALYQAGKDDRNQRASLGIGYYGGLILGSAVEDTEKSGHVAAGLKLVNGEDLYVELTYPDLKQAVEDAGEITAAVTVADEHGTTVTLTADGDSATGGTPEGRVHANVITNGDYTLDVLLDSLTAGGSFADLPASASGAHLSPGDEITVTATLLYDGTTLYENQQVGPVNSLFESKTVSGTAKYPETECVADCIRQLHNLEVYCGQANPNETVTLKLGRNLDFTDTKTREKTTMPGDTPVDTFPSMILLSSRRGITLDGNGFLLRGFVISEILHGSHQTPYAGLIGYSNQPLTLKNLLMEDPEVHGTRMIGALAGKLQNDRGAVTVEGCGVYLSGGGIAGGVFASSTGEADAGGLVGVIQASKSTRTNPILIRDSFAALPISNAGKVAGGLIGSMTGGAVQNCYASGAVYSAGRVSGGLAGRVSGAVTITGCFAVSSVWADRDAGVLVGRVSDTAAVRIADTRAYGTAAASGTSSSTYGPMAGSGDTIPSYSACLYLSQSGDGAVPDFYQTHGTGRPDGVTACEYGDLAVNGNRAADCHPYDPALSGAFPFLMLKSEDGAVIPYYGNWPEEICSDRPYGLCYYETYTDDSGQTSWGFFGYHQGGGPLDTLAGNDKTITAAGYGVAVPAGAAAAAPVGEGGAVALGSPIAVSGLHLELYPIPNIETEFPVAVGETCCRVTDKTSGRTLYIHPKFAAAVSISTLPANESTPMQIRTERQLQSSGMMSGAGWYFRQTHDIQVTSAATGLLVNGGGSTYDGAHNTITGLRNPLFSSSDGILKGIRLDEVEIQASGDTAALATFAGGTVSDCGVLSGSVVSTGGCAAGLILEAVSGTVSDCFAGNSGSAEPLTVSGSGFSGKKSGASGLIGTAGAAGRGTVVIRRCAVTRVELINPSGRAAGFVSFNNNAQIMDCSVTDTRVTASDHAGGFCIDNYGEIDFCHVLRCRVTSNGTANMQDGGNWPYACGFAYCNKAEGAGSITDSWVSQVTVTGTAAACGFVHENESGISRCYAVVDAVAGPDAAGFVLKNDNAAQSTVTDCFTVGKAGGAVAGTSRSGGFTISNSGTMTRCYAAVSLVKASGICYGFGPGGGTAADCYWCRDGGFNSGLETSSGAGTRISLEALEVLTALQTADWTTDSTGETHSATMTGAYPYPRLSALDYYGDWPEPTAVSPATSGKLGAAVLYRQDAGNNRTGASGCLVDFSVSPEPQSYAAKEKFGRVDTDVLMSPDLAGSGDWTVTVSYQDWWGDIFGYELDLARPTADDLTLTNLTGCSGYSISAESSYGTLQSVTFRSESSGETYTFAYDSAGGTFH